MISYSAKQTLLMQATADTTIYGGARYGGKMQPLYSKILTPFGWKIMEDMKIGSIISNPDGTAQKVIQIFNHKNKQIYKIDFDDGSSTECGLEHLWLVRKTSSIIKADRRYYPFAIEDKIIYKVWQTRDILDFFERKAQAPDKSMIKKQTLIIPLCSPIQFTKAYNEYTQIKLHPYLIGILIGDGSLTSATVCYTSADEEIMEKLLSLGYNAHQIPSDELHYSISDKRGEIKNELRKLKLWGCKSATKFIPEVYKWASIEDRIELMKGLVDTDGYVDKRGYLSYTTVSERLAKDVQFIVRSLGSKATITDKIPNYTYNGEKKKGQKAYTIYINGRINIQLAHLRRKANLLKKYCPLRREPHRTILNITKKEKENARCIVVDNPNGLYITDDFIVTHNTFACACKMALDICEWYSEAQVRRNKYDVRGFRTSKTNGVLSYYKMLIDYPHYKGLAVRRTEPELNANTKIECDKIYPQFGGKWDVQGRKYKFPSGAEIFLRPCHKEEQLGFFQGPNFHRLWIGELTQFKKDWVDKIEFCCRSTDPRIPARQIYDTNPGGIGHNAVKRKYINKCRPIRDGAPVYLEKFDIYYQSMMPNKPYKTDTGETYLFIPALIFDNPYVEDKYIQKLLNKNEILKQMWLYGNWDVFIGQYFDMWDDTKHKISEKEFFNAIDNVDLIVKKRSFDWSDYRLYRSFDYGFKAPWVCGAYAVHNRTNDVVKFAEIVKTSLTSLDQARLTKKFFLEHYNLRNDDFEMNLADPKSFWKRSDTGEEFKRPADFYRDEGIILMGWDSSPGSRVQGAMITAEALRIREDGTPRLTFLSNCEYNIETIPNLPSDKNNLDDIDTKAEDHAFDELKGFLMMIIGNATQKLKKKKGWRDTVFGDRQDGIRRISWKVA